MRKEGEGMIEDMDEMHEMKEKVAKRKIQNKKHKMLGKAENETYGKGKAT